MKINKNLKILGVTVLTSLSDKSLKKIGISYATIHLLNGEEKESSNDPSGVYGKAIQQEKEERQEIN